MPATDTRPTMERLLELEALYLAGREGAEAAFAAGLARWCAGLRGRSEVLIAGRLYRAEGDRVVMEG